MKDEKETETAGGTQLACGSMGGMDYESTSHKRITKELADNLSVNTAIMYSWRVIYRIYGCIAINYAFFCLSPPYL